MKFVSLTSRAGENTPLQNEYASAYAVGKLRLGQEHLFFRAGFRTYFIAYSEICRYFRRVTQVPAKMCCGRGNFEIESLVVCNAERELAQIELPGTRAAKAVMERLARLAPDASVGPLRDAPAEEPQ